MKKLILSAALAVSSFFAANAQFGAGVEVAMPMGSFGDAVGFGVGATVNYDFAIGENMTVGAQAGYIMFLPKTQEFFGVESKTSASMIPILGVFKYYIGGSSEDGGLYLGANVGVNMTSVKSKTDFLGTEIEVSASSTDVTYAPVVGFKTEGGLDLSARYQIVDGGAYLGLRIGMNF